MARYYPNGSGNNRKPKDESNPILDPGVDQGRDLEHNMLSEWLYADDWNEDKLRQFELMYHGPMKDYMDYLLDLRADQEYLDRFGMEYTDIHDPRKLKSVGSAGRMYGSVVHYVSDMAKHLYR